MRLAKLDQRITIERQATTVDAYGERTDTWQTVAEVWAQKLSRQGQEFFQAGRTIADEEAYFIIRTNASVTEAMRISHNAERYDITSIQDDEQRQGFTQLTARRLK